MSEPNFGVGDRSSRDSKDSIDTSATSIHTLPPLQTKGPDGNDIHALEPLLEDDPRSFDLFEPPQEAENVGVYAMEKQALQLFSSEHLSAIFANSKLLHRFTGFLNSHRPQSIPLLIYYLDALKALRAIKYANAVAEALEPITSYNFTKGSMKETENNALEEKANKAFEVLVREDLPAYITYTWIQVVSTSISRRITGTLAPHLRESSEGLAEVFCLSDPSRPDNPIVFASEEFTRTTQYGLNYSIGRNCRFLQGPKTDPNSPRRLAEACAAGKEQSEVFVNYRRDGSPFMNLLMIAPLMDSRGVVRYYIGAQVDVSGLLKSCSELPGLAKLVDDEYERKHSTKSSKKSKKDEFQELSEMFNSAELDTVRRHGGSMHREYDSDSDSMSGGNTQRPRLMLSDPTQETLDKQKEQIAPGVPQAEKERINGRLAGVYQNVSFLDSKSRKCHMTNVRKSTCSFAQRHL
jgi:PAS domain-containing protein